jgi:hypothetical protein
MFATTIDYHRYHSGVYTLSVVIVDELIFYNHDGIKNWHACTTCESPDRNPIIINTHDMPNTIEKFDYVASASPVVVSQVLSIILSAIFSIYYINDSYSHYTKHVLDNQWESFMQQVRTQLW